MYKSFVVLVSLLLALAVTCVAVESGFKDVLDTPAMESRIASKALFNGIVNTGKRLVCAGQRGIVIYSEDGGVSWKQARVPVSSDLLSLSFPVPEKGWVVGHEGTVLHSTDGGSTWVVQLDGRGAIKIMNEYYSKNPSLMDSNVLKADLERFTNEGPDKPFLDVWFKDESSGYVVGAFNFIFRTRDGGKNWEPLYDRAENPDLRHLYSIRRVGQDLFIVGEQGLVLKHEPQKDIFRRINMPYKGTLFGILGAGNSIIAFGMQGKIYRSTNGGADWKNIETSIPVGLTGGTVLENGTIVIVSQAGHILTSSDQGASFKLISSESTFPSNAVTSMGGDQVMCAGLRGVNISRIKE